jgi:hypothetical protein
MAALSRHRPERISDFVGGNVISAGGVSRERAFGKPEEGVALLDRERHRVEGELPHLVLLVGELGSQKRNEPPAPAK